MRGTEEYSKKPKNVTSSKHVYTDHEQNTCADTDGVFTCVLEPPQNAVERRADLCDGDFVACGLWQPGGEQRLELGQRPRPERRGEGNR